MVILTSTFLLQEKDTIIQKENWYFQPGIPLMSHSLK